MRDCMKLLISYSFLDNILYKCMCLQAIHGLQLNGAIILKMVDLYSALRNVYFSLSARYEDNMGVSCNKHPNIIIIFMHRLLLLHKGL